MQRKFKHNSVVSQFEVCPLWGQKETLAAFANSRKNRRHRLTCWKGIYAPFETLGPPPTNVCCTPDNHRQLKREFLTQNQYIEPGNFRRSRVVLLDNSVPRYYIQFRRSADLVRNAPIRFCERFFRQPEHLLSMASTVFGANV